MTEVSKYLVNVTLRLTDGLFVEADNPADAVEIAEKYFGARLIETGDVERTDAAGGYVTMTRARRRERNRLYNPEQSRTDD